MRRTHLIAATLLTAGLLAACGGEDGGGSGSDAATALADALAAGQAVESGTLDLSVLVEVDQTGESGEAGGSFDVQMNGPFENSPDGEPSFDLETTATQTNTDPAAEGTSGPYEGELLSTGEAGYLLYDQYRPLAGNYELDPSLYELLADVIVGIPDAGPLVSDPQLEVVEDEVPGGQDLTHISGQVDTDALAAAVEGLIPDAGDLGFGVDPASDLPPGTVDAYADLVESSDVDVYIGEDGLVRTVIINAELSGVDVEAFRITIDSAVTDIGKPVEFEAPTDTEPLSNLPKKLGQLFAALG